MRRELIIAAGPGEWRAALVEDGAPVELRIERGDGIEAGSIHLGRVLRLLPSLGAALIDIGDNRPAFLPQSEIFPRGRRLDEGERILTQIRREAQGGKAARLSTGIVLCGRFVELIIGRPGIFGGEALSVGDRARLAAAAGTAPHPTPTIAHAFGAKDEIRGEEPLRGSAIGLRIIKAGPVETLIAEAATLHRRWVGIADPATALRPPARLYPAATFAAALAGVMPAVQHILVDQPAAIPQIRAAFQQATVALVPETEWPVDLDALFAEALSVTTALPGGASIHFEPTRAAVLIDVDSGTPDSGSPERTALAVNLAAAQTIARQIRLRNLGGGIVIDFVGLDDRGSRDRVRATLSRGLAADAMQPQILGWTRLGHLEVVRPRRTCPLADSLLEPAADGAIVKTSLTLAHEALRALQREARAQPGRAWRLTVAPAVAAALADAASGAVGALEQRFGRAIAIAIDGSLGRNRCQIAPA